MVSVTSIIQGNVWVSTATFTTEETNEPVDPDVIEFGWRLQGDDASPTLWTYVSSSSPGVGIVARTGTGVYVAWVDLTLLYGTISWKWQSTGSGQAAVDGLLAVPSLPF